MSDPVTIADYIRKASLLRGIDPDTALRVFKQESGFNPAARNISDKEESYGVAQLNVRGGLGAVARQQGIEPSDASQWPRQVDFALDTVKKDGWRQWYGARDVGIGRWDGVGQSGTPVPSTGSVNPGTQPPVPDVFSPIPPGNAPSSLTGPDTPDIASVFRLAANPPDLSAGQKVATLAPLDQQEPADFQQVFDPRTTRRMGVKRR